MGLACWLLSLHKDCVLFYFQLDVLIDNIGRSIIWARLPYSVSDSSVYVWCGCVCVYRQHRKIHHLGQTTSESSVCVYVGVDVCGCGVGCVWATSYTPHKSQI